MSADVTVSSVAEKLRQLPLPQLVALDRLVSDCLRVNHEARSRTLLDRLRASHRCPQSAHPLFVQDQPRRWTCQSCHVIVLLPRREETGERA